MLTDRRGGGIHPTEVGLPGLVVDEERDDDDHGIGSRDRFRVVGRRNEAARGDKSRQTVTELGFTGKGLTPFIDDIHEGFVDIDPDHRVALAGELNGERKANLAQGDNSNLHENSLLREDLPRQVMGKAYIPARLRPVVATLVKGLESVAERRLDLIVAATPAIAQKFTPERTLLVQNFPWLSDYPTPVDMPAGRLTLCYVGGISHGRGIVEMVQAVRSVGDGVRLVLAGPITPQAQALLDASSDLPIEYVGQMPGEDIPQLLAASSVGLALLHPLPNYLESQATKIFEYMASGRAFIASDFPAWRAMFERFDCGLFVNPLDPDAVADAVRELAGDPEHAAAMGMAGRRAMQDHFTFEHEGRRLVERVLPA